MDTEKSWRTLIRFPFADIWLLCCKSMRVLTPLRSPLNERITVLFDHKLNIHSSISGKKCNHKTGILLKTEITKVTNRKYSFFQIRKCHEWRPTTESLTLIKYESTVTVIRGHRTTKPPHKTRQNNTKRIHVLLSSTPHGTSRFRGIENVNRVTH